MLKQLKQFVILMPAKLYVDRIKMSKLYEIYSNFCSRYRHLQSLRCTCSLMAFNARIHVVSIFEQCPTAFTKSITGVLIAHSFAHRHARTRTLFLTFHNCIHDAIRHDASESDKSLAIPNRDHLLSEYIAINITMFAMMFCTIGYIHSVHHSRHHICILRRTFQRA